MTHRCAHPLEVAGVVAAGLLRELRPLLVGAVALGLLLAGYRPAAPAAMAAPAPAAIEAPAAPAMAAPAMAAAPAAMAAEVAPALAGLTVRELRQQARAAGHRALARSGRRAELLAALEAG